MMREPNKRPRRNPLTSEEVLHIIAHKKKRELVTLLQLKKSRFFKLSNIFNILCFFVYLELVFCYYGPSRYQKHYTVKTIAHYGSGPAVNGRLYISDIDLYTVGGKEYKVIVEEGIGAPEKKTSFIIGKDFLLQKELKVVFEKSNKAYRLFAASPVLFLSVFVSFISAFGFIMNLNENAYTLTALTILNALTMLAVILI